MRCTNCGFSNSEDARYCVSCGTNLHGAAEAVTRSDINRLEQQLQELRAQIAWIGDTLANRGIDIPLDSPVSEPAPPVDSETPLVQPTEPSQAQAPEDDDEEIDVPIASSFDRTYIPPPPRRAPRPENAYTTRVARVSASERFRQTPVGKALSELNWEAIIGGNWLARIGALAVIIGVAFFLRLAFDNNWINETARVILGVVSGLAFMAASEYWRKKYPVYAQALAGTGVALFYLAIFAAFATYGLINIYTGISLLLLISVASAGMAIRQDSISLAIIGIAGAFFAPFILGAFAETGVSGSGSASGDAIALLVYIFVVDIGVIVLSTFRNWQWFTALALAGSLATFGLWHDEYVDQSNALVDAYGRPETLLIAQAGLTSIFLSFVAATTMFHLVWRRIPRPLDLSLMLVNAMLYMSISYALMFDEFRDWMGGFTILVSAVYGGVGVIALKRIGVEPIDVKDPNQQKLLTSISFGIGLILLTIAVPIQIGGPWISVAWTAEGVLLLWLSFRHRMPEIRFTGFLVLAGAAFWLGVIDTPEALEESVTPFWNRYLPAYVLVIVGMWTASYLVRKNQDQLHKDENDAFSILAIVGIFFLGVATPVQIRGPWLAVAWTVEAMALMWVAFNQRSRAIRYGALAVFAASAIWLVAAETPQLFEESVTPFWNAFLPIYLIVTVGIAFAAILVKRNQDQVTKEENYLFPLLAVTSIAFIALGTAVQVNGPWIAFAWSIEAVLVIWASMWLRILEVQLAGLGLLGVAAMRALIFDSVVDGDDYTIIWNSRFLAFGPLIAAVCAASFLLSRAERLSAEIDIKLVSFSLVGVANALALYFLSAEVIGAVQSDVVGNVDSENEGNVISLGLTVLWAVYGGLVLGVGFIGGWRAVRMGGLVLLAIPVLKLFLVDSFQLESGFRVAAFLTLGVILLIGGYLYQRHADTINELFFKPGKRTEHGTA